MRLLLLGTFNIGALEHQFVNGFRACGFSVQTYDITKDFEHMLRSGLVFKIINRVSQNVLLSNINRKIVEYCKTNKPDIVFVVKGLTIFPDTLEEIRQYCKLLVNYNPDHPFIFYSSGSGNSNISNGIVKYDLIFSYSRNICEKIIKNYGVNSHWIPFGYDPQLEKLDLANFACNNKFLFVGAYDKYRARQIEMLGRSDILIYGDENWGLKTRRDGYVRSSFKYETLYGLELINQTNNSIASLNILRAQNVDENSHNMRTFEVPAMGGVLISNYTDEQAYFFEPEKEMVFFSSLEEFVDKLNYLKRNPNESIRIKSNALARSRRSNYNYNYRCVEMMNVMDLYFK